MEKSPHFPLEIWRHIFSYCDYYQLKGVLSLVCHTFANEIRKSSAFDRQLFRSKDICPLANFELGNYECLDDADDEGQSDQKNEKDNTKDINPLDKRYPKHFKVHPALRQKVAITTFRQSLTFLGSKSKYKRGPKPMPKDAWGRKRFKDLGQLYLSDCNVFQENATEPPVNKMLVILRFGGGELNLGGYGYDGYPPMARAEIDLTQKDGDQAVKVAHVLKCLVEYERNNKFNDDTEETIETRICGKGGKTTFETRENVFFGEEEENFDGNDGEREDRRGQDYENSFSEEESDEEPDPEEEEQEAQLEEEGWYKSSSEKYPQRKYLREMDCLYATFNRQIQHVQPSKECLTLWGFMK